MSLLAELRILVPNRPLRYQEAQRVAETQADRLRTLLDVRSPELPEDVIPSLPRIEVRELPDLPSSGSTQWCDGRWVIALNGLEPWQRQRFSLGHELWHVINYQTVERLCPYEETRAFYGERLADYFSGCLHMPRQYVRQLTSQGYGVNDLADLFGVSGAAVNVRLSQLGVTKRCPGAWHPNKEVAT